MAEDYQWMRAEQAAAMLGVTRRTLTNWRRKMSPDERAAMTAVLPNYTDAGRSLWLHVPRVERWCADRELGRGPSLLSTDEAGRRLGVTSRTVRRWASKGAPGTLAEDGVYRVADLEALERWLAERREEVAA